MSDIQFCKKHLDFLEEHPDALPDIEQIFVYYLLRAQKGGVDNSNCIAKLATQAKKRIKEKGIIIDRSDLLFKSFNEVEGKALDGARISNDQIRFISKVSALYLKLKENSADTVSKYNSALIELYNIRNRLSLNGEKLNAIASRMFDYIDMTFIKESSSDRTYRRTQRFNQDNVRNYYKEAPGKNDVYKMLQDIKPYVIPTKRNSAINTGVANLGQLDAQIYIQAYLMLEYGDSLKRVLSFIKKTCNPEIVKVIINELFNYSSRGPEFYEYVLGQMNMKPTEQEKKRIKILKCENALFNRKKKEPKERIRRVKGAYDLVEFKGLEEETRYLESQTKNFNLSHLLLSRGNHKGIIVITQDKLYALNKFEDKKAAFDRLCSFVDIQYFGHPLNESYDAVADFYSSDRGYVVVGISKTDGKVNIDTHFPEEINEFQANVLKGIGRNLIHVRLLSRSRFDNKSNDEFIDPIDESLRAIYLKLPKEKKKSIIPSWFKRAS